MTEKNSHPAYGTIAIGRRTGGNVKLFGSAITQDTRITIKICEGIEVRRHHENRHQSGKKILELEMSFQQFGELMASTDYSEGVPCTISWVRDTGSTPKIEDIPSSKKYHEEFEESTKVAQQEFVSLISFVTDLMDKPAVTKAERKEILSKINGIRNIIRDTIPFIAEQFGEFMDKTEAEARTNISGHFAHMIRQHGIEAIIARNSQLEGGDPARPETPSLPGFAEDPTS